MSGLDNYAILGNTNTVTILAQQTRKIYRSCFTWIGLLAMSGGEAGVGEIVGGKRGMKHDEPHIPHEEQCVFNNYFDNTSTQGCGMWDEQD